LDGADIGVAAEFISGKSEAAGRKNDNAKLRITIFLQNLLRFTMA
jgi:hypothetical protein